VSVSRMVYKYIKRRLSIGRIAYSYSPCIQFYGVATASIVSWSLTRCPTAAMNLALIPVPPMSSAVASSAVYRWKAQGIMAVIRKTGSLGGTVDASDTRHSLSRLRTADRSLTNCTPEVLGSRLLRLARHSYVSIGLGCQSILRGMHMLR
jgi:hypothetical protein